MTDAWIHSGLSPMAAGIQGSSILAIAARVRALIATGREVCNLTIGDFDPKAYPIPRLLLDGTIDALRAGYTNYPPANGIEPLRQAVARMYQERRAVAFDPGHITVASGARPVLYAAYAVVVAPGDQVVYSVPSWNNNHYAQIFGASPVEILTGPETGFFPAVEAFGPYLRTARMIVVNSPLNPTGTMILPERLQALCDAIVAENERRRVAAERPLFLLYDQIYWMLSFGAIAHCDPVALDPRMADYTIYIDGVSKCFAATGLRVGWAIAPAPLCKAMNALLGHIGAWAPHAEQVATARMLQDSAATDDYLRWIRREAADRLSMIHARVEAMAARGWPVRALAPEGAIYLSVCFDLIGWRDGDRELATTEDIGALLLDRAGVAMVPFAAFGAAAAGPWFRLSVGAVQREALGPAWDRIEAVLTTLARP